MNYQNIFANSLFELREVSPRTGQPNFANREAILRSNEFSGNRGVYGVFYNETLIYVGISFNLNPRTVVDPIIERWRMHLTYFALRSPQVSFSPRNMFRILNYLKADFVDTYKELLGSDNPSLANLKQLENQKHPLLSGRASSFKKARFAATHWDTLKKDDYLDKFSFAYKALPTNNEIVNAADVKQLRYELLIREAQLVDMFQPICNDETVIDKAGVCPNTFLAACDEVMKPIPHWSFP